MATGVELKPTNAPNTSWHVTIRSIRELKPFLTRRLKATILNRFYIHLSPDETRDRYRRKHTKLIGLVEVAAYCVMDNHLHVIIHQFTADGMYRLMQRVLSAFVRDYNRGRPRKGPIFDARHAATPLRDSEPDHVKAAIAYVHLNHPIEQLDYEWGSHIVLTGERACSWIDRERTLAIFGGVEAYVEYMNRNGPRLVRTKLKEWGLPEDSHPYRPCAVSDFKWYSA